MLHPQHAREHLGRRVEQLLRHGDREEAADRAVERYGGNAVPTGPGVTIGRDQLDHQAVGIAQPQYLLIGAGDRRVRVHAEALQALLPPAERLRRHN